MTTSGYVKSFFWVHESGEVERKKLVGTISVVEVVVAVVSDGDFDTDLAWFTHLSFSPSKYNGIHFAVCPIRFNYL